MFTLHVTYLNNTTSSTDYATLEEVHLILAEVLDDDILHYEIIKPKA